jgi:hypothetical protein
LGADGYRALVEPAVAMTGPNAYAIERRTGKQLFDILTGISGSRYRYGISPNTDDVLYPDNKEKKIFVTKYPVPLLAVYDPITSQPANFPSGFEVAVGGPSSQRQVYIRVVVVAQGNFRGIASDEHVLLVTARDLQ